MVKGKVIFEDEEKVEIKYPCFELKDVVEYYFEICTPDNSISPFSLVALGISPKQCFRALRFKVALKNYRSKSGYDLYEELGYTDFSHFVKEAKDLTHEPPSEL